jgi:hypothetical protein
MYCGVRATLPSLRTNLPFMSLTVAMQSYTSVDEFDAAISTRGERVPE